jgi:hypothetical protein
MHIRSATPWLLISPFPVYLHREDGQSYDSIVAVLFRSPLSSNKVEFDIDVDGEYVTPKYIDIYSEGNPCRCRQISE